MKQLKRRFILFHPSGAPQSEDVTLIKTHPEIKIVDGTDERAFLVEADHSVINVLRDELPNWVVEEEKILPGP